MKQNIEGLIAQEPRLTAIPVGIAILQLSTGRTLYQRNADTLYNVASNTKIITIAAALARLGPNYQFRTEVMGAKPDATGTVRGHLYVRGFADPSLHAGSLYEIAQKLRNAGVRRISRAISIDDSYFDSQIDPPHFNEQPQSQAAYRAPVGATSIHANTISVIVTPAADGKSAARVNLFPRTSYVQISGTVRTVPRGRTRIHLRTKRRGSRLRYVISGKIHLRSAPRTFRRRIPTPHMYFGDTFRNVLQQAGIRVARRAVYRRSPPKTATPLVVHYSAPLGTIVQRLGKDSNNYAAEMLLKTLGAQARPQKPARWRDGIDVVHDYLHHRIGLEPNSYRYENGSGLFSASAFSPNQLLRVLEVVYHDFRYGPDLVASLAIAGKDGTLRSRMRDQAAAGITRAKTGTLAKVKALAGYVGANRRNILAFAIAANGIPNRSTRAKMAAFENAVVNVLATYTRF